MDHTQQNVAPLAAYAFPQLSELLLVLHIFSLLPVDQRLRCAEVSRAWRATVALPELWRRVDLSVNSDVEHFTPALLHAVVARAGGALTALDMTDTGFDMTEIVAALRAASQLVEVRLGHLGNPDLEAPHSLQHVTDMLTAAPQLRELHTSVMCGIADCVDLLEGRPPYEPLRLVGLDVLADHRSALLPRALVLALADTSQQPCLSRLLLNRAHLHMPGALDAIADAVVARGALTHLCFHSCIFPPSPAPALARALRDGFLTELQLVSGYRDQPFPLDMAGAALLGDALHVSQTFKSLALCNMPARAAPAVAALIHSLVGHGRLCKLDLSSSHLADATVGAALTALLAADTPALLELKLPRCRLGEACMGLLCDALPRNSHLCSLHLDDNMHSMPAGFFWNRLLPAVRANTSLQDLEVHSPDDEDDAAALAEALHIIALR